MSPEYLLQLKDMHTKNITTLSPLSNSGGSQTPRAKSFGKGIRSFTFTARETGEIQHFPIQTTGSEITKSTFKIYSRGQRSGSVT